jgi:hypothetical protein
MQAFQLRTQPSTHRTYCFEQQGPKAAAGWWRPPPPCPTGPRSRDWLYVCAAHVHTTECLCAGQPQQGKWGGEDPITQTQHVRESPLDGLEIVPKATPGHRNLPMKPAADCGRVPQIRTRTRENDGAVSSFSSCERRDFRHGKGQSQQ